MVNKLSRLKKKLIQNAAIIASLLVALTVGALVMANFDDDAVSAQHSKEGENSQVRSDRDTLKEELSTGLEIGNYYDNYVKNHSSDFVLKRESATQWFTAMREKNHITNLSITIAPLTDMKVDGIQLKTGDMVKSEVHLTFNALTDNSVYTFIEAMERELPGIALISDIKITRKGDMTRSILIDLSHHKITPLVSADITFQWIGIRPQPDKKTESPK